MLYCSIVLSSDYRVITSLANSAARNTQDEPQKPAATSHIGFARKVLGFSTGDEQTAIIAFWVPVAPPSRLAATTILARRLAIFEVCSPRSRALCLPARHRTTPADEDLKVIYGGMRGVGFAWSIIT